MAAEANATQEQQQQQQQQQQMSQEEYQQRLKYLEFVHAATLQLVGCFAGVYDYAKSNSGPLKPGVQTVEGTVKTVVGPVYEKFHAVPLELLKIVDRKVDFSVHEIERRVPSLVKEASDQAYTAAQKAPQVAQAVVSEVQRSGVVGSATGAAKTAYSKYEPVAEQYAATAWHKLNKLPLFPQVAHAVLPTAAYCTERYNSAVCYTAEKGYTVSSYLPLVPVERIAKVFGSEEDAVEPAVNAPSGGEIAVA